MRHTTAPRKVLPLSFLLLLSTSQADTVFAGTSIWTGIGPEGGSVGSAIDPLTPTTLCATSYGGGVFKSTNGGGYWSAVNTNLINTFVTTLATIPAKPTILYVETGYDGVSKDTNDSNDNATET